MLNMIRAHLYRLSSMWENRCLAISYVVLLTVYTALFWDTWQPTTFAEVYQPLGSFQLPALACAIGLALFYGGDFKNRTVRNLLVDPASRRDYVVAMAVSSFVCALVMTFISIAVPAAFFIVRVGGFNVVGYAARGLALALALTAMSAIAELAGIVLGRGMGVLAAVLVEMGFLGAWVVTFFVDLFGGPNVFASVADMLSMTRIAYNIMSGMPYAVGWVIIPLCITFVATLLVWLAVRRKNLR